MWLQARTCGRQALLASTGVLIRTQRDSRVLNNRGLPKLPGSTQDGMTLLDRQHRSTWSETRSVPRLEALHAARVIQYRSRVGPSVPICRLSTSISAQIGSKFSLLTTSSQQLLAVQIAPCAWLQTIRSEAGAWALHSWRAGTPSTNIRRRRWDLFLTMHRPKELQSAQQSPLATSQPIRTSTRALVPQLDHLTQTTTYLSGHLSQSVYSQELFLARWSSPTYSARVHWGRSEGRCTTCLTTAKNPINHTSSEPQMSLISFNWSSWTEGTERLTV